MHVSWTQLGSGGRPRRSPRSGGSPARSASASASRALSMAPGTSPIERRSCARRWSTLSAEARDRRPPRRARRGAAPRPSTGRRSRESARRTSASTRCRPGRQRLPHEGDPRASSARPHLAGGGELLDLRRDRAPSERRTRRPAGSTGRCRPAKLRRHVGRAPRPRPGGRLLEQLGDRPVGPSVDSARCLARTSGSTADVPHGACSERLRERPDARVDGRRRRADGQSAPARSSSDDEQAPAPRALASSAGGSSAPRSAPVELRDGRAPEHGDATSSSGASSGGACSSVAEIAALQRLRAARPCPGGRGIARELDREERVPARDRVDASRATAARSTRRRPRGRRAARRGSSGPSSIGRAPIRRERPGRVERVATVRPERCEHPDRLVVETAKGVPERTRRRGVEPLEVVDRRGRRAARTRGAATRSRTTRPRSSGSSRPPNVGASASTSSRRSTSPEVRQHALLGRRSRDEHGVSRGRAPLDAVSPHRCLADARVAANQEHARAVGEVIHERVDGVALRLSPHDVPRPGELAIGAVDDVSAGRRTRPRASRA